MRRLERAALRAALAVPGVQTAKQVSRALGLDVGAVRRACPHCYRELVALRGAVKEIRRGAMRDVRDSGERRSACSVARGLGIAPTVLRSAAPKRYDQLVARYRERGPTLPPSEGAGLA